MKTIFQKDLRENLKIALIGLALFSLLLLQAYQSSIAPLAQMMAGNWAGQANTLQPLLSSTLLTEAAFFCAIFGAALGWLQTRNEAHRDLWAFLVHRPVTRAEIFRGKALAGLCLYFFGAGLPLAILVAVVRVPGHVAAPFEWAMTLPLLSIFLAGTVYYFAGMLTGLRQARWFGSKGFGLGLAGVATLGIINSTGFWPSTILMAVAGIILATAVWGAYQTGGFYRGLPRLGKASLILTLSVGCGMAFFLSVALVLFLILNPLAGSPSRFSNSNYQMTRDNVIYKTTSRANEPMEITDLDGHPLLDPKTGRRMEQKEFQKRLVGGAQILSRFNRRFTEWSYPPDASRFFTLWSITDKTLWYLDRHGRLTGYDAQTRKRVGQLAPAGGAAESFLREPYAYSYYNSYNDTPRKLLPTAKSVYQVDLRERTVKSIFTVADDDEIGGYSVNYTEHMIFTTRKLVCELNAAGQVNLSLPYQPGYVEYPQVQLYHIVATNAVTNTKTNGYAVWFIPDYQLNGKKNWQLPIHVQWVGADQAVVKHTELPFLHDLASESWPEKFGTALLPPLAHIDFNREIFSLWDMFSDAIGIRPSSNHTESAEKIYHGWNLFSFLLAVVCAVISWTLTRRYHFSTGARIGWTLFVFLLGLAGLLTFLCVQEWPAREACPNCKKLRCVDREDCEYCAEKFSPPEKNGTEIFAEPAGRDVSAA